MPHQKLLSYFQTFPTISKNLCSTQTEQNKKAQLHTNMKISKLMQKKDVLK